MTIDNWNSVIAKLFNRVLHDSSYDICIWYGQMFGDVFFFLRRGVGYIVDTHLIMTSYMQTHKEETRGLLVCCSEWF